MNAAALVVGLLTGAVTVRGLINGSGSADGQGFRRDEEPAIYWSIIAVGAAVTAFLLWLAISNRA